MFRTQTMNSKQNEKKNVDNCNKERYVSCDICDIKNIDPDDVGEDYNLAEIGGGYCCEGCITEELLEEYTDALKL